MPTPDNPVDSVIRGQEYFRLKQVVQSPGDIYELNESTRAVYIGPDSDIAEARITYYNPSESLGLETADISVNGPFVGRVDALLATSVPSTAQPARILAQPVDIVNNAYRRPNTMVGQGPDTNRRFNIPTSIDLICALKTLPSIPQVRADKTFRFPNVPYGRGNPALGAAATDLVIPIYGRRMITCQFVSGPLITYRVDFFLVALQPGQSPGPKFIGSLSEPGTAFFSNTNTVVIKASDSQKLTGIQYDTYDTAPVLIEQTYLVAAPPLPEVKGFADLLVMTLVYDGPGFGAGAPALLDCFIKLTDRES